MKIALVYDHVNKIGGAERILEAVHELFPQAPLYTAVYNKQTAPWAKEFKIITSFMQYLPYAKSFHEFYPGLPLLAFKQFNFENFDIVISITSAEAKSIITPPKTLNICYCLTPTRYLWSHYQQYFNNKWLSWVSWPLINCLRIYDKLAAQKPDVMLAISKTVKNRIKKYYQREVNVIYPPVSTDRFNINSFDVTQDRNLRLKNIKDDSYFLIVSRLVRYKRIDVAIGACNKLKLPLIIIGEGMDKVRLKKFAGSTIKFLGNLTDDEVISYYRNCRAFLMSQEEDFGITAVEAQAHGKPVVAYRRGGATEIVIEGETGEFFNEQTVASLADVLKKFTEKKYSSIKCKQNAQRFSKERFKREFEQMVKTSYLKFKKQN